jgi:signal transduction histidine kinase
MHRDQESIACAETEGDSSPRFAKGTLELDRLPAGWLHGEELDLQRLDEVPYPAFALGGDGVIQDLNAPAEVLAGCLRADLVGRRLDIIGLRVAPPPDPERARFVTGTRAVCVGRERTTAVELLGFGSEQGVLAIAIPLAHGGLDTDDIAQIVHDFKNPISAITLETCLLEVGIAAGYDGEVLASIGRIARNAEFLDRMVHDLLDVCALDSGALELRCVPTELRTLLEQTIARVVPQRDRARVFLDAPEPMTISLDDLRIERVVANLLGNALKYSPASTGISIRLERPDPAWCCVSISDAGPGMTPAEARCVFDKYRRGALATRDSSGLGLYVSKQIVELHGGRIGVDSVRGCGSRFFFELPLEPPPTMRPRWRVTRSRRDG